MKNLDPETSESQEYPELVKLAYNIAVVLDGWSGDPGMFEPETAKFFAISIYKELHTVTGLDDLTSIDP
jgi:hypothetical protein